MTTDELQRLVGEHLLATSYRHCLYGVEDLLREDSEQARWEEHL
jgi:hypothetical protein